MTHHQLQLTNQRLQKTFVQHRQCGVALPGGADTLVHLRRCLERAAGGSALPAIAGLDLDLRNAFPSLEWPAVRSGVHEWAPELDRWTAWRRSAARRSRGQRPA